MENLATTESTEPTTPDVEPKASENDKPKDEAIDIGVEALLHLNHGKRHLLVEDYQSAVASLQESCQLFDQRFGIGAEECGEAYLYYGTALLELARLEDGLFDGVVHTKLAEISGDEETEDEEEEEEEESQEESQDETESKEKSEEKKTDTEEDIENSDEEKKKRTNGTEDNKTNETKESTSEPQASCQPSTAASSSSAATPMECQPSTSKSSETNEEADDDNSNDLEVSWEVLCLAKNVFTEHADKNDNKLKLAETLQKLGEISIEWENNVNAIDLLTRSLALRKEMLPEDDRLIAETYYHLGIAYSFNNNIENANNCFHSAIQVIESRIANQKQKLSTVTAEDLETSEAIKREISRLESLLPEMKVKIEDQREQTENAKEALAREEHEKKEEEAITSKNSEAKDKPVTNISHLIKRKRTNSGSDNSPKKLCSNGANVVDNGNSEENESTN